MRLKRVATSLHVALVVALLVGTWLAQLSPVRAQAQTQTQVQPPSGEGAPPASGAAAQDSSPGYFAATGYRVADPAFLDYFQRNGGVRTFGYPVSNDFVLLGTRVQIFQRHLLQQRADGSVGVLNLLADDVMPLTNPRRATLPLPDPLLVTFLPLPGTDTYLEEAAAYLERTAPDEWSGLPVGFAQALRTTVTCLDLGLEPDCDPAVPFAAALEVLGLPTSYPAADPTGQWVYQRFQKGILEYSVLTGITQGVLLGDWFKGVLLGAALPPGLAAQMVGSRYYRQYSPFSSTGVARPAELPDTLLAAAFGPEALAQIQPTQTPTPVPTPTFTPTPTETPVVVQLTPTPVQAAAQVLSENDVVPSPRDFCWGDETIFFAPLKPYANTEILIAVSSARRHDVARVRLAGPVNPGQVTERRGLHGWVYEWRLTPPFEGYYIYDFFVDGARRCLTAGFPVLPAFSGPTPTPMPAATEIPTPTNTPQPPAPRLDSVAPSSGGCSELLTLNGNNFGTSPIVYMTGPSGTKTLSVLGSTNTQIQATTPPSDLRAGAHSIVVSVTGAGASNAQPFNVNSAC